MSTIPVSVKWLKPRNLYDPTPEAPAPAPSPAPAPVPEPEDNIYQSDDEAPAPPVAEVAKKVVVKVKKPTEPPKKVAPESALGKGRLTVSSNSEPEGGFGWWPYLLGGAGVLTYMFMSDGQPVGQTRVYKR